ncbi:MAG: CYTH domain-containing protein [Candidatus Woesearchaeota archaeon]
MKEIEVKVLDVDKKKIIEKLKELGAKKVFDGIIDTKLFDFPSRSLLKNKIILRLRKEGTKNVLTMKKILRSKFTNKRLEIEVNVNDYDKMLYILKSIGLKREINCYLKKRITYKLGSTHFEFDLLLVKGLKIPWMMEIEAKNEKIIRKYLNILGIPHKNALNWSGDMVIEYYKNKKVMKAKND